MDLLGPLIPPKYPKARSHPLALSAIIRLLGRFLMWLGIGSILVRNATGTAPGATDIAPLAPVCGPPSCKFVDGGCKNWTPTKQAVAELFSCRCVDIFTRPAAGTW